jgi:hypothetical protein
MTCNWNPAGHGPALPGRAASFHIVPLIPLWRDGAHPSQVFGDHFDPIAPRLRVTLISSRQKRGVNCCVRPASLSSFSIALPESIESSARLIPS